MQEGRAVTSQALCQDGDLDNCSERDGTGNFSFMTIQDKMGAWKLHLYFIGSTCP